MTRLTQYSEAFWGTDFTSTAGFDALARRNHDQKKFLHEFEEYLRKRSKIESEYSKAMGQLAKSLKDRTVIGVLEEAWNCLRAELETVQKAHDDSASFFSQHADDTKKFCRELTARRDVLEDKVKKSQSHKASQYKTVNSLNKAYGQKCRENDQLSESYDVIKRSVTASAKDIEKAKGKKEKSSDEANKADVAYKSAVQALDETRQDWERDMEQTCKEFQERDEEQLKFLRSQMWLSVNTISQAAFDTDEGCERVRKVLERCDMDQDIQSFIAVATTGTQRPAPILYQNYYEAGNTDNTSNSSSSPSPSPPAHNRHRPLPSPFQSRGSTSSTSYYSVADVNDDNYSSADPIYSSAEQVDGGVYSAAWN